MLNFLHNTHRFSSRLPQRSVQDVVELTQNLLGADEALHFQHHHQHSHLATSCGCVATTAAQQRRWPGDGN